MNEINFNLLSPVSYPGEQVDSSQSIDLNDVFSEDYLSLLKKYNGGVFFENGAKYSINNSIPNISLGYIDVIFLYGLSDDDNGLLYRISMYSSNIPSGYYPLGESSGGDQVCINIKTGEIYFWWHEAPTDPESLYFLSKNIESFIDRLTPIEGYEEDLDNTIDKIDTSKTWLGF
ncbi:MULTISPECIES: SMI1/KNR4 family protein [unclassified Serratia (in: enterobacteria)]|uniref:SMI1/KNR4 family protein n=1 Tax=unclassified Serratia (in: enterobacteria) TaxID=2647522 RepID=UPI00046A63FF|nr:MULTISPECIES: SMI1/KNR4 family protein [unclassified Serratia (in: enterobacteria)]